MLSMTHSTESKEKKEICGDRAPIRAGGSGAPLSTEAATLLHTRVHPAGGNRRARSLL